MYQSTQCSWEVGGGVVSLRREREGSGRYGSNLGTELELSGMLVDSGAYKGPIIPILQVDCTPDKW